MTHLGIVLFWKIQQETEPKYELNLYVWRISLLFQILK